MKKILILFIVFIGIANAGQCSSGEYIDLKKHERQCLYNRNDKSCSMLGRLHQNGWCGAQKNSIKAYEYYGKACQNGSGQDCMDILYDYEKGLFSDKEIALNALAKHGYYCLNGRESEWACVTLFKFYRKGFSVEWIDYEKVLDKIKENCRKIHPNSCYEIGYMYLEGSPIQEKDIEGARFYFSKSCDHATKYYSSQTGCKELNSLPPKKSCWSF